MRSLGRFATVMLSGVLLAGCSSTPTAATPTTPPDTVSRAALSAATHNGSRLRLGAVRERTASYTSYDVTYPPHWARATQAAMQRAGVESTLEWYDNGHAVGPTLLLAMDRTICYLDRQLGG